MCEVRTQIGTLETYLTEDQWKTVRHAVTMTWANHRAMCRYTVEEMVALLKRFKVLRNDKSGMWGFCSYTYRHVELSFRIVKGGVYEARHNGTLMHEIAHAISYFMLRHGGHGRYWKEIDRLLGGTGQRCHSGTNEAADAMPFVYQCRSCGKKTGRSRRYERDDYVGDIVERTCGTCSPRKYNPEFNLVRVK